MSKRGTSRESRKERVSIVSLLKYMYVLEG